MDNKKNAGEELDLAPVDAAVAECGRAPGSLIRVLQALQKHYRYLPEPALRRVCALMDVSPAAIAGVATFYAQFRLAPVGRHMIKVCHGTACHVAGAQTISDILGENLGISPEGGTTEDKFFTVEKVACLGCCSLAPVMMIDEETYGRLDEKAVRKIVKEYRTES